MRLIHDGIFNRNEKKNEFRSLMPVEKMAKFLPLEQIRCILYDVVMVLFHTFLPLFG